MLRPRVVQKEPPRLGSTICYGEELARKSTKTRQYDLLRPLRPRVGQKEPPRLGSTICCGQTWARKEPPRLGSTICYGQTWARKSHQNSALRFVTAKSWPEKSHQDCALRFVTAKRGSERATKTRQYDLLRPNVGQKEPPKTRQYDLLRPKSCPERATKTDLLRPNVGQKEPRLGSTICYGQTWARKSHQNSAVRFVTAKSWPERATKTRQYDLLRPNVGQKEPPKLGSTICYGQMWARKSHQDSAVRFVTAKSCPERATKTRQYDLLRPRVGQKEPPRLGSTICCGQTWARKSHQNSAVRFVTAKSWPEKATKTRQYDLLRPNVGQKEPPRLGSTICYGQELSRKSHQDSAVRFVTAKSWPERATKTRQYDLLRTKTRQYDLLRPRVVQKEPPRLGSTICYGQELARKSHQDSAVRFVTAKRGPERATKIRQYDLLRPRVGQKEPPRFGSTICYGQELSRKSHQDSAVRFVTGQELARKSHQDSAVRFVTAKSCPERATKIRQYDLLRPRVGQKEPPRLGNTICYGQTWARKSHRDSAIRFVTAKRGPERATKTRQYDLLRPRVGQKEPPRLGSTICYGQTWARKSHQNSAVRFVTAKSWPERTTKTRQYDLLRPRVVQKEPPRLGSTICYGQELARNGQELSRKSHQDSAVRFVTAKSWPERATKTRQYDLIRPNVGQKELPKFGSTICYGQELARKSHQDSAVRFVTAKRGPERANQNSAVRLVTAKSWPERATKTRQYDLLRPNVGQKEPPKLGSTICYGQMWARKSHQDSAVRFVTAKSCPERATKTRQYDLLRPRVGQKAPPRTRQYDLLRPNVGQKEPPTLGSTICYGQELARKNHQDSAARFVTAKRGPERATKTRSTI